MNPDADIKALEAVLASLRVWILSIAAAFLELVGARGAIQRWVARRLRRNLGKAEYDAKRALFLLALARMPQPEGSPRRVFALGYALKRRKCSDFRRLTHGAFNARPTDLRARIDRLRDMVENAEAWIVRMVAHLSHRGDTMHRILAAPPRARGYAPPFAPPRLADSS